MHPILCSTPTLALSAIYCLYRAYLHAHLRRRRLLHQRVAYMLWVMAAAGRFAWYVLWDETDGEVAFPTLVTPEGMALPLFSMAAGARAFQAAHPEGSAYRVIHLAGESLRSRLRGLMARGVPAVVRDPTLLGDGTFRGDRALILQLLCAAEEPTARVRQRRRPAKGGE
jgi:hypothetical protein